MAMNLDEAWRKYLADMEEIRQMFLAEPIIEEYPATEAAAITLLHQTIALSYNLVMAPRQDHPVFHAAVVPGSLSSILATCRAPTSSIAWCS